MPAPEEQDAITPLPVPRDAAEILLLGGTFDPPHRGHIDLAARARDLVAPGAWLVVAPAARSPFKSEPPIADEHRLAMLRLAAADIVRTVIWTDEIDRARAGEPSYWIDTVRRAAAARPDAKLWFLIGSDQAVEFHRWREAPAILERATPIVLPRSPLTTPEALGAALREVGVWSVAELARWRDALAPLAPVESSATHVRALLRTRGPDEASLRELLGPAVLGYIREHRLYTS